MYNQPKKKPIPPLYKKHLNKIRGVIPKVICVAGKCPAAKSKLATMFAIKNTIFGTSFFSEVIDFLKKIFLLHF